MVRGGSERCWAKGKEAKWTKVRKTVLDAVFDPTSGAVEGRRKSRRQDELKRPDVTAGSDLGTSVWVHLLNPAETALVNKSPCLTIMIRDGSGLRATLRVGVML